MVGARDRKLMPYGAIIWLVFRLLQRSSGSPPAPDPNAVSGVDVVKVIIYFVAALVVFGIVDPGGTLFPLGLAALVWIPTVALHWLAWRVCQPLRLRRLGTAALWLAPHRVPRQSVGRRLVFSTSLGRPIPARATNRFDEWPLPLNAWLVCAAVLEAEHAGNEREAAAQVDGLLATPIEGSLGSSVRRVGIELITHAAARRRDWREAARRASLGRGRGPRFLRLVARSHIVGDVHPALLSLAWILAPSRIRNWALLRGALGPSVRRVTPPLPEGPPWRRHVDLLERAASGEPVELATVVEVSRSWDALLSGVEQARFRARALELGSARSQETFERLRAGVLDDLLSVAASARGAWPGTPKAGGLPFHIYSQLNTEAYDAVDAVARTRRQGKVQLDPLRDEWRLWVRFRAALHRLADRFGEDVLRSTWYGGAQNAAWNWPCQVLRVYGAQGAWLSHIMFQWTTEMAKRCRDEEATRVNEKNIQIARQQILRA
jgi:hypothetical protein